MKVRLRELRPNPVRDFGVDPLDQEAVDRLRASIRESGFWGGVVGRQRNGHIEIGAGHHRVEAALQEGIEEGDVHVLPEGTSDRLMIRIYAEENATQRGTTHSTARAGSVAAALRQAAYEAFFGRSVTIVTDDDDDDENQEPDLDRKAAGHGIGWRQVKACLNGVPGITTRTIQEDLASLKKSGEYARIIGEVRDRIEAEREYAERVAEEARRAADEALLEEAERAAGEEARAWEEQADKARQALEKAQKQASKAAEQEQVFDFRGVAPYFPVALHLAEFRKLATSDYVRQHLPMDQQSAVAEGLVRLAKDLKQELTGLFIRTNLVAAVMQLKESERQLAAAEKERLLSADWEKRFLDLQNYYLGALRNVILYGEKLLKHRESEPAGGTRTVTVTYRATVAKATEMIERVEEGL